MVAEAWLGLGVDSAEAGVDVAGGAIEERKPAGGGDGNPVPPRVGVGVLLESWLEYTAGTETECECVRGTGEGGCLGEVVELVVLPDDLSRTIGAK